MCGISIAVNRRNNVVAPDFIKNMTDKVIHRGPDDEGYYFGDNFAFGHRRLSIIDLSQTGHQPMKRKHLWITYNGEVYNYLELKDELKSLGHSFQTTSDTEVILAAYDQWDKEAFTRLNGMWSFAIYDSVKNEIILCRDHFGIKPLYFTRTANWFLAGSEIKQFTVFPELKKVLNKKVAANFLVNGSLNYSDETFFQDVHQLRAGHFLRYDLGSHQSKVYQWYDLAKSAKVVSENFDKAVLHVGNLFRESVRIRMRSDVRVGSCLSGGLDSSSIVCSTHRQGLANPDFSTITSCYHDMRYDEQHFSDEVTKQTGFSSLKVFPELNHLLDELDKMIYHQDQPFSTASHYSEFKVFQKARENGMIVMQGGQGSDEYLCGYGEFFVARLRELVRSFEWVNAWRHLRQKASHNGTSLESELGSFVRSAYMLRVKKIIKRLLGRREYSWLSKPWQLLADSCLVDFGRDNVRDLSIAQIGHSSIPYQLHSEDRNSMLFSIESRLPFLDHRLVEYGIGLPSSYKIRKGFTKAILREAMDELPELIRKRKDKMGFVAPDADWVRTNKDRVRSDLESIVRSTGIFSADLLVRFDKFIAGKLGYEPIYFRAMTLSRFCRIFEMEIH